MNCFNRGKLILMDEESGYCYYADTISVDVGIAAGIYAPRDIVPCDITATCLSVVVYDTKNHPELKKVIFNMLCSDLSNNFRKQHGIAMKRKKRRPKNVN